MYSPGPLRLADRITAELRAGKQHAAVLEKRSRKHRAEAEAHTQLPAPKEFYHALSCGSGALRDGPQKERFYQAFSDQVGICSFLYGRYDRDECNRRTPAIFSRCASGFSEIAETRYNRGNTPFAFSLYVWYYVSSRLIGRERNSRLVGKILSEAQQYGEYPCHRVVNHAGRTAPGWAEQMELLRSEDVQFKQNGCVDLRASQWEL